MYGAKDEDRTRSDMEQIYLDAFRINMLKDSSQLVNSFVHVVDEVDLGLNIAEEYIVRDKLTMWETDHLF